MSEYTINGHPAGYSIGVAARVSEQYAEQLLGLQRRAEAAEAKLAAVRKVIGTAEYLDSVMASTKVSRIRALLTPTPSPGAGTGEGGK